MIRSLMADRLRVNRGGDLALQMPMLETTIQAGGVGTHGCRVDHCCGGQGQIPNTLETDYHAMVLSLRDCAANLVWAGLLGLSGEFDSALVATIAVDAWAQKMSALCDVAVGIYVAGIVG